MRGVVKRHASNSKAILTEQTTMSSDYSFVSSKVQV